MLDKNDVVGLGIVCLTTLESIALVKGFDGQFFSLIVAAIAGLLGLKIKTPSFLGEPILLHRQSESNQRRRR